MSAAAFIAAEKRHAATIGVPGTLIIDGVRCPARLYAEQGQRMLMEGGSIQHRELTALVLVPALDRSHLLEASGDTRTILIKHLETGFDYRITPGGVNLSPWGVYWEITCAQPTAT